MSISEYTITQLESMLHKKEISAEEIVDSTFKRINEVDGKIGAFITTCEEESREQAKKLDESGNTSSKLFAIPAGIKDNIVTKGIKTTAASKMLENFNDPLYDATVIEKIQNEQSLLIGKLNMDEFAMGSTNETSAIKEVRNPWNLNHVPGGSSGGSAAAVAAGEVLYSLGTDTGGSVRQPASFCGVVGMKPTYGLVSRYGLIAMAPSLDQIGPITKNVEDNARVLEVIAGHDSRDSTSSKTDIPLYTSALKDDIKGLKIAVPQEFLGDGVSKEVKESIMNALQMYELLGASWEKVSLPHLAYADAVYYLISSAEGSSSLARYDGVRYGKRADNAEDMIDMFKQSRAEGFGEEVKRRILLGSTILSAGYNEKLYRKAQKVRTLIKNDFEAAFAKYDVIIGPTTPTEAFKFGEKIQDPLTMYTSDLLNVPVNLAGLPAISLPCGFSEEGLPFGLQIIGKHFDESTVYRAAYAYEQATNHHKKRPELGGADE